MLTVPPTTKRGILNELLQKMRQVFKMLVKNSIILMKRPVGVIYIDQTTIPLSSEISPFTTGCIDE